MGKHPIRRRATRNSVYISNESARSKRRPRRRADRREQIMGQGSGIATSEPTVPEQRIRVVGRASAARVARGRSR